MISWILLAVLALLLVWLILIYNGLVAIRNDMQSSWNQIDVQLKRRHDLIPNLVQTVKGAMEFEQDTLEKVISARAKAVSASTPAAKAEAENMLTQTLGKLFAVMENYPDLKSNRNAMQLQEELTSTENRIAFARQLYNDLVANFRTKIQVFPNNIVSSMFNFQSGEYFGADETARAVPAVDLSLRK
ncbi:MAG TPA: LemA family protein [Nitrospirota bacterium]|jgi:LemA protein|nr:LemA family protein [Nitrospirota bacterium]